MSNQPVSGCSEKDYQVIIPTGTNLDSSETYVDIALYAEDADRKSKSNSFD